MNRLSRRDFLKLGGLALSGLAFTSFLPEMPQFDDIELVRVAHDSVSVYKQPDFSSRIVRTWMRDDLVHVYETVQVETANSSPLWYRVFGGYMNGARLQKVKFHHNPPLTSVPNKLLAEVTVPYIQAYRYNQWDKWYPLPYRLYYSCVQWIFGLDAGPDGKAWYIVQDDNDRNLRYFVPVEQLRPIAPAEFTPITPALPLEAKWIDISLDTQTLTAYENDQVVRTAKVSSGVKFLYDTPVGRFNILVKLPSRRMSGSSPAGGDEGIELAGVPWCSFFTEEGHALHGTYWHDNFGIPMSHGCVNMRNEDALWIFRWTHPQAGFESINLETLDVRGFGTLVDIHK